MPHRGGTLDLVLGQALLVADSARTFYILLFARLGLRLPHRDGIAHIVGPVPAVGDNLMLREADHVVARVLVDAPAAVGVFGHDCVINLFFESLELGLHLGRHARLFVADLRLELAHSLLIVARRVLFG